MNFPPRPRARSSSAGALGKDSDTVGVNLIGTEISMMLGTLLAEKV